MKAMSGYYNILVNTKYVLWLYSQSGSFAPSVLVLMDGIGNESNQRIIGPFAMINRGKES